MADKIHCDTHGESRKAYVCQHFHGNSVGLGFNREEPTDENPFPDAWCDDCELIRSAYRGWNDKSEKLTKIVLSCSGCYESARIRNTRTAVSLGDLAGLRWKCGSCDEWHDGPCLDFGYNSPIYWNKDHEKANRPGDPLPLSENRRAQTYLTEDLCVTDGEYFYIRGLINLPIIGTAKNLSWGVWGSLSHANFEKLLDRFDEQDRNQLPPMFSWLSNQIPEYPDTLNLKMYAHIQKPPDRPVFELETTDHPLSREYRHGITPERVKEIMLRRLPEAG
jgi:hypothetical protein